MYISLYHVTFDIYILKDCPDPNIVSKPYGTINFDVQGNSVHFYTWEHRINIEI
jgi:hypothetical protein